VHPVSAAGRDPSELLHVHVDELARPLTLKADRGRAHAIQMHQARQAVTSKHAVDRGSRVTELRPEPMGADLQPSAGSKDPIDLPHGECLWATVRGARSILQPIDALLPEPS
jgi:hypothetical protein